MLLLLLLLGSFPPQPLDLAPRWKPAAAGRPSARPVHAQVPARDFFLKTLYLFDGGEDVGMVLSPQAFHNLNPHADIFNHANIHFWEYMQPGYDALGFISCTGTNFLMRAQAFMEVGAPRLAPVLAG